MVEVIQELKFKNFKKGDTILTLQIIITTKYLFMFKTIKNKLLKKKMNSKPLLFTVGVGLPLVYYFGRDIIYDATANYLGDNRRIRKRQVELKRRKREKIE